MSWLIEKPWMWFVIKATPEEIIEYLENAGIKVIATGLQHGTVTAVINHIPFEITTLRIDTDHDGRHCAVQYTKDWKQDAERRDLTVLWYTFRDPFSGAALFYFFPWMPPKLYWGMIYRTFLWNDEGEGLCTVFFFSFFSFFSISLRVGLIDRLKKFTYANGFWKVPHPCVLFR